MSRKANLKIPKRYTKKFSKKNCPNWVFFLFTVGLSLVDLRNPICRFSRADMILGMNILRRMMCKKKANSGGEIGIHMNKIE